MLTMPALRARIIRRQCQKANRARNAKLSPEERSRSAKNAAVARWSRLSLDDRRRALRAATAAARSAKRKSNSQTAPHDRRRSNAGKRPRQSCTGSNRLNGGQGG
jgi:hypothetical protein